MDKKSIIRTMKWFLLIVLALSVLIGFTACQDDIVGPQINEEEKEDEKDDGTGEDPADGGIMIGKRITWNTASNC